MASKESHEERRKTFAWGLSHRSVLSYSSHTSRILHGIRGSPVYVVLPGKLYFWTHLELLVKIIYCKGIKVRQCVPIKSDQMVQYSSEVPAEPELEKFGL